jgi:protein associated with RNAse G/E
VHDCVYLGSDRWGDWVGQPAGAQSVRPGREFVAESPNVTLLDPDGQWAATCYGGLHPRSVRIYIDLAWDVGWDAATGEPVGIDMDLDVVRCDDERGVWIDDRDEWDEHRVAYGYPSDVVARLEQLAVALEQRVVAEEAPFDDATAARWLAVLQRLDGSDGSGGHGARP